jgi:CheY-like chemotaxis protein
VLGSFLPVNSNSEAKPKPPILLVEENPDDYYLLSHRIKATGVENPLICHFDGDDAIHYLTQMAHSSVPHEVPAVLFTDIKILGQDGLAVVAFVRTQAALRHMKIYIVTNSLDPKHQTRAAELSVDGFLAKFPTVAELQRLLSDLISPRV